MLSAVERGLKTRAENAQHADFHPGQGNPGGLASFECQPASQSLLDTDPFRRFRGDAITFCFEAFSAKRFPHPATWLR
jgi:hypothetical protein